MRSALPDVMCFCGWASNDRASYSGGCAADIMCFSDLCTSPECLPCIGHCMSATGGCMTLFLSVLLRSTDLLPMVEPSSTFPTLSLFCPAYFSFSRLWWRPPTVCYVRMAINADDCLLHQTIEDKGSLAFGIFLHPRHEFCAGSVGEGLSTLLCGCNMCLH